MDCRVVEATHVEGYTLKILFADGHEILLDFTKALDKYAKGYYAKFKKMPVFKKFKIDGGNLVWGKHWDLFFPPESIYRGKIK